MQQTSKDTIKLAETVGALFKTLRTEQTGLSLTKLAYQYDLDKGNLSRVENGQIECKLVTAIKICQAIGIKFSEFAKLLEDELGEDFNLIDE